jgi:hypothetical protein
MRDLLTELPVGVRGRLALLRCGLDWLRSCSLGCARGGLPVAGRRRRSARMGWTCCAGSGSCGLRGGLGSRDLGSRRATENGSRRTGSTMVGVGEPDRGAVAVRTPARTGRAVVTGDRGEPFGGARPGAGGTVRVGQPGQPAGPTVGADVGAELAVDLSRRQPAGPVACQPGRSTSRTGGTWSPGPRPEEPGTPLHRHRRPRHHRRDFILAPPPVLTASRTHAAYRSNVPILGSEKTVSGSAAGGRSAQRRRAPRSRTSAGRCGARPAGPSDRRPRPAARAPRCLGAWSGRPARARR